MKTETIEEYIARGGYIFKIIDTSDAYKKGNHQYVGKYVDYTKKENTKKNIKAYQAIAKIKIKGSN